MPIRLLIFAAVATLLLCLERVFPRRAGDMQRARRWPVNASLVAIDSLLLAALPLAAVGSAVWAEQRGTGLFHHLAWPAALEAVLAWLVLDLAIYWQHRGLHMIRWLWPLHRVHHTDIEFDTTTAVRFHPVEIVLSMLWKVLWIVLLGAPLVAVIALEVALSSFALWSHANLKLSPALDHRLRWLLITPDMHRIHHSVYRVETDSNFGSTLSVWDRLFGSYIAQPRDGHDAMRIGLPEFRAAPEQKLGALLLQPLR